jgi:uncharacterized cupin superfamily protein
MRARKASFWRTGISKELDAIHRGFNAGYFPVVLDAGGKTGCQLYAHAGEEGSLVLDGNVAIDVDGKEHRLQAGDGFRLDSARRHSFWNIGPGTAHVLWVNARPKAAKPTRNTTARTTPSSRR